MKKFTQIFFALTLVASVAFAQQTRNTDIKKVNDANTHQVQATDNTLVTSIMESFEGTFPPAGWSLSSPDGGTGWEAITVGTTPLPGWQGGICSAVPTGNGGNQMAYATWSTGGATSNDQWMISPQVTISNGYTISFWLRKSTNAYFDQVDIKISTTGNQTSNFTTTLAEIILPTTDSGWFSHQFDLSAYAGQNIYIAFNEHVADNFNDGDAIFIDMVRVDLGSGVNTPVNNHSVRLFPNPVRENLNIESAETIQDVRICNILGTMVLNQVVNASKVQINTSDLQPGAYFVTIKSSNGIIVRRINIVD